MSYLSGISSAQSLLTSNLESATDTDEIKTIAGVMQNNAQTVQKVELLNMVSSVNNNSNSKSLTENLLSLENTSLDQKISDALDNITTETENIDSTSVTENDTSGSIIDLLV